MGGWAALALASVGLCETAMWTSLLVRVMRKEMEQEPIVFISGVLGLTGCILPLLFWDGGRRAQDEATTYAYRIKYLYPKRTPTAE